MSYSYGHVKISNPEKTRTNAIRNREYLRIKYGNKCFYCGVTFGTFENNPNGKPIELIAEIDHLIPFYISKSNDLTNLVITCNKCNKIKGRKIFDSLEELLNYVRFYRWPVLIVKVPKQLKRKKVKKMSVKHGHKVHKYERVSGVWTCALRGCTHFLPGNVVRGVVGRTSICFKCENEFLIDAINQLMDRPICQDCDIDNPIRQLAFNTETTNTTMEK